MIPLLIMIAAGIGGIILLRRLRPQTLEKVTLSPGAEKALTLGLTIVFMVSIFFILYFLVLGMISWFSVKTMTLIWAGSSALLIGFGAAGTLLLPGERKARTALISTILGILSLILFVVGHYIISA